MLNKNNKLYDNTIYTAEENVWSVYGVCVFSRVLIGITAILALTGNKTLLALSSIITFTFINILKKKGQTNWKSYWKPIINYSTIALINSYQLFKGNSDSGRLISAISGVLMINDAVSGLESRILIDKLTSL